MVPTRRDAVPRCQPMGTNKNLRKKSSLQVDLQFLIANLKLNLQRTKIGRKYLIYRMTSKLEVKIKLVNSKNVSHGVKNANPLGWACAGFCLALSAAPPCSRDKLHMSNAIGAALSCTAVCLMSASQNLNGARCVGSRMEFRALVSVVPS